LDIGHIFKVGGPVFAINTFFLACVIAVIVERTFYFLGRSHIDAKGFLDKMKALLAANNADRAKKLCDATSSPIARVAKAGLNRMHRGEAAIAQSMEEAMMDVAPEIKTRIGSLWSLANIATLTGLVGTVIGLINTFGGLHGEKDPERRIERLSMGIEEAMYNTAFGLGIALICMIAHLLLSAASKKVLNDLESFSIRFENMLGEGHTAGGHAAPASLELANQKEIEK